MRILLVGEVYHPETIGGAGRVLARLAEGLAARGHAVRVVTRATPTAPGVEDSRHGVRIFRYPAQTKSAFSAWTTTRRGVRAAVERALRGWAPDILHGHQPLAARFAAGAAGCGVAGRVRHGAAAAGFAIEGPAPKPPPIVYTFYAPWPAEYRTKKGLDVGGGGGRAPIAARALFAAMSAIEADLLASARIVACLSRYSAAQIAALYPRVAAARPPRLVPGGVDLERFRPTSRDERAMIRERLGIPEQAFLALTVRNLVPRMGLDVLLEAVAAARPAAAGLLLGVAGDGPLRETLAARAARPDLDGAVRLFGAVAEGDLPDIYRAADLFVLPTRALEGFGLVVLEAYATGLPVLATNVGAIPELVSLDGRPDLLVEPRAPALTAALIRAVRDRTREADPAEARRRRRLAEGYTWDRMVEAYEAIYREVSPA